MTNPKTGKVKTVPVYRGEWYAFTADAASLRRARALYLSLSALVLAMFLLVLTLNAPCGHMFYVMPPFACMVFPVFFLLAGCRRLCTAGERFTREHNDKLLPRFTGCLLALMALGAASLAGHVVYVALNGATVRDVISLAATATLTAASLAMFREKPLLQTRRLP